MLSIRTIDDTKWGQQRKRGAYLEADLLTVARRISSSVSLASGQGFLPFSASIEPSRWWSCWEPGLGRP